MRSYCKTAGVLLALVLCAADVFALSNSLDELLSQEEIVMPANLEERYPIADAVIVLDGEEIDQARSINPVYIAKHVAVKVMNAAGVAEFSTVKIPYFREVKINDMSAQIIRGGQIIKIGDIVDRDVDLEGADKGFVFPIAMGSNVFFLRPEEKSYSRTSTDLLKLTFTDGFHKQKDKAWKIRQLNFTGLQPGDIIEYQYQFEDKRAQIYSRFDFQRNIPALKLRYIAKNAKMMKFNYQVNNFTRKPVTVFEPRFTNLEEHDNLEVRTALRTIDINNPESWQFFGHQYFDVSLDTVDAFHTDVPFSPSINDAAARIDVVLADIFNVWFASDTDARVRREHFSPNWNYVFKRITDRNLPDEAKARRAIAEISKVIAQANSPEDKVSAAVNWARENLKLINEIDTWDGYYWSSEAESPDNVLHNMAGNSDDIAHFVISTLWFNNLPVFPFYTKSREKGSLIKSLAIETQFDQTLLALEVSSRRYKFWQPTLDVPMPANYIDHRYEGQEGFVNLSDKADVSIEPAQISPSEAASNLNKIEGALQLAADGTLSGTLNQSLNGHFAADIKRKLLIDQTAPAEAWTTMLNGNWNQLSVEGQQQLGDPKELNSTFTASGNVKITGTASTDDGLTLRTAVVTDPYSALLKGEERDVALVYPHTADVQTSVTITIPAGYALPDSLPAAVELKTRGIYYNRVVARQSDNTLLIKRDFMVDGDLIVAPRIYNTRYAKIYSQIKDSDAVELKLKKL